jgi:hypothetical protein
MKLLNKFIATILIVYCVLVNEAISKVEPANYNFSLDAMKVFLPGNTYDNVVKKYGKGELVDGTSPIITYKFYIAQIRYKFPVYIQVFEGKVLDFFARLPTYFSHDLFHQAIINRYGKQDIYKKFEENALYTWKDKKGIKFIYSGTCTITCFPIYFSGVTVAPPPEAGGYQALIQKISTLK